MTITDIHNKIYFLTKTNSTSLPAATALMLINNAYDRVVSLIMQTDGRWEWDDTNQTDFPIATTAIVATQQDYTLAATHLSILRVELKNTDGKWIVLKPIDQSQLPDVNLDQYFGESGIPVYYDKLGASVLLYPTPNFSQAASLKINFQRPASLFTSGEVTTGTKQPGFNSLFHDLIPLWASYDYAIANGLKNANQIMLEIQRKEHALKEDYAFRSQDERNVMTSKKINYI
jgi:hypothetical protein